jgi:hypothetical protein
VKQQPDSRRQVRAELADVRRLIASVSTLCTDVTDLVSSEPPDDYTAEESSG